MVTKTFTPKDVVHIAHLARIPVTEQEQISLSAGFNKTIDVVNGLFDVDTRGTQPTHQVTGTQNILREDETDPVRMLTQTEALTNTQNTHNGFFVVERITEQES